MRDESAFWGDDAGEHQSWRPRPKDLLQKVYDDALSGTARQVGKLSEDTIKAARLLLAPLQFGAALQDRFEGMFQRIANRVPNDRRIEPPAEIVGPTLEMIRFISDDGLLWGMFEEVLTKSCDRDGHETVHPFLPSDCLSIEPRRSLDAVPFARSGVQGSRCSRFQSHDE
jgi:hypothetical protein